MSALIDAHSHFFSRVFFETLAAASPLSGDIEERMARVCRTAGIELPPANTREHLARWMGEIDTYGLHHLVSFASVPEEASVLAEAAAASDGRIVPFLVVDPTRPDAVERLDVALAKQGFRGALFFPAMHRYRLDGPEAAEVFDVLARYRATAIVHCGILQVRLRDLFGLPRGYDLRLADPLTLIPAADAHPDASFVIPHFGAGLFRETLIAGTQCANVLVDTSSSNSWRSTQTRPIELADVFERTLRVFGPERILFGTDSSVFPRGWRREILLAQREALGACGVSGADRARILGGNARDLLRLE